MQVVVLSNLSGEVLLIVLRRVIVDVVGLHARILAIIRIWLVKLLCLSIGHIAKSLLFVEMWMGLLSRALLLGETDVLRRGDT